MVNKPMRKCSTSQFFRETQIKTTIRYHLTPIRMAAIQNTPNHMFWEDVEKLEILCPTGKNIKWCSRYGRY